MRRLKKILAASRPILPMPTLTVSTEETSQEEVENLLLGMFRDLPQDQRQTILDIVAEVYSLTKRAPC